MSTWIKLLDSIHEDPRVFRMGELLAKTAQAYILAPTADLLGPVTNSVTRNALRDVTIAGLSRVWRAANRLTTDGVFLHATLDYLDTLAQITGFGKAMAAVGYARHDDVNHTVTLPRFAEHNAPDKNGNRAKTANAERQQRLRDKRKLTGLETLPRPTSSALQVTPDVTLRAQENNVIPSLSSSLSKSTESTPLNQTPDSEQELVAKNSKTTKPIPSDLDSGSDSPPPLGGSASAFAPLCGHSQALSLDDLQRRINALRPKTWGKMLNWSAEDANALFQAIDNLRLLESQDWLVLGWFMRWANTGANTNARDPVRVTSRRHQFVSDISSYLDRATATWKAAGAPKLTSDVGTLARNSPSAAPAKDPPTGPTDTFQQLARDLGIQPKEKEKAPAPPPGPKTLPPPDFDSPAYRALVASVATKPTAA